jgi:hypothetical protein
MRYGTDEEDKFIGAVAVFCKRAPKYVGQTDVTVEFVVNAGLSAESQHKLSARLALLLRDCGVFPNYKLTYHERAARGGEKPHYHVTLSGVARSDHRNRTGTDQRQFNAAVAAINEPDFGHSAGGPGKREARRRRKR